MRRVFLITFFSIIAFLPIFSNAQLPGVDMAELILEPERPGPNETVSARLQSSITDLNLADISWIVNDEIIASGKGVKSISFKTGAIGKKLSIDVMIVSKEGFSFSKNITFNPAKVDLIFESESYAPPFYKGKTLYPYQGVIRVIAVPSFVDEKGKAIPKENLIFNWKQKDKFLKDYSGYGKDTIFFRSELLATRNYLLVEVSTPDNKYLADNVLVLNPVDPKVVFYEEDPQYGILYNKALFGEATLKKEELKVVAIPYFFNVENKDSYNLKYNWSLNGQSINRDTNFIVLKNTNNSFGLSNLALQVTNTIDIFQFVDTNLRIKFDKIR